MYGSARTGYRGRPTTEARLDVTPVISSMRDRLPAKTKLSQHSVYGKLMSDFLYKNSEDPDALPINERSSAFIDGTAFLEFVRLKSRVTAKDVSTAKKGAVPVLGTEAANGPSRPGNGHGYAVSTSSVQDKSQITQVAQIEIEDWDSLFEAVEERLCAAVEEHDSVAMPAAAQDSTSRIRAVVLDCVSALDTLHRALRQERSTYAPPGTSRGRI
jgi:hypothetical protein